MIAVHAPLGVAHMQGMYFSRLLKFLSDFFLVFMIALIRWFHQKSASLRLEATIVTLSILWEAQCM